VRIRDIIAEKKERLESITGEWMNRANKYEIVVKPRLIAKVVAEMTGIPVEDIEEDESEKLLRMEDYLAERVRGQQSAIQSLSRAVRRSRVGLGRDNRPNGSFIFLGPTGVGKTELARALAEFLFGDEKNLVRLDMSEFMEKHSVSRLIGSPPGYIGYEEGGQLTEKVKRRPYSVILMDEIEKAHPDIFNILLQVLDEGELTDSSGTTVSFRDTVIIMTSNIGNSEIDKTGMLGFGKTAGSAYSIEKMNESLKKVFSPEFLNRVDEIITFNRLTREDMAGITDLMIEEISDRLYREGVELSVPRAVKAYLLEKGFDEKHGARNLRRVIQRELEDGIADKLLLDKSGVKVRIRAFMKNGSIAFRLKKSEYENSDSEEEKTVKAQKK